MSNAHSTETFREIPRLPGYRFGDMGTIQTIKKRGPKTGDCLREWQTLTPFIDKGGYATVGLTGQDGRMKHYRVHRLVLEAFVGPCPEGQMCRHGDGNRRNNVLFNLSWGTAKENSADRDRHGTTARRPGELHHNVKLTAEKVVEIRRRIAAGEHPRLVAAEFGIAYTTATGIANRFRWKHVT
jgi:hypothetical protein